MAPKPARFPRWLAVLVLVLTSVSIWSVYKTRRDLSRVRGAQAQRLATQEELGQQAVYWQTVADRYPTYRDAYARLAEISWAQQDMEAAKGWVARALTVDPNWAVPATLAGALPPP